MNRLKLVMISVAILAGSAASAGSDHGACRREESRLRSEEADRCAGWNYLLNPSACFNARKALSPYDRGKCGELAPVAEIIGEKASPPAIPVPQPAKGSSPGSAAAMRTAPAPPLSGGGDEHSSELTVLRRELSELRREVELLKDEIARLKGGR